jgi:hypothetical protein
MSVVQDFQVSGLFPSVVSAQVSTAQYFPRVLGSSIGNQSAAASSTTATGQLIVPGNSVLNGQWFDVLVSASFLDGTGDPSSTAKLELVANTGTVASPTYTVLANATTSAPGLNASQEVSFRVSLIGNSASGVVSGFYTGIKAGALVTTVLTDNNLSGVNFNNSTGQPFGLLVRATFSATATAPLLNVAKLTQFQIVQQ